ncbi:CatB-related O-acetyltransferase [Leclercia adecarboxylata]|uniref:CatB-related O-acetyltransferase n=1 Tax=Leclercia adecarboxylata TaxID=83655 RepID=UPI002B2F4689|nr:CatB-related O-acetyltransferase [Leclercia adecarboxylata]
MANYTYPDGLVLPPNIPELHPESSFELPVCIQATLAHKNKIEIGAFTGIYGGKVGHCVIGRYCSIASGVDIASDQHPTDWLSSSMVQYVPNIHGWGDWLKRNEHKYTEPKGRFLSNSPVHIGNDVWIGQGVFIKSGVNIGDGAVIAAHSVVVNDIPPYAIAAGVPAKVKKYRFSNEIINRLLEIKWWNYNILSINDIDFSDIEKTLLIIEEKIKSNTLTPFNTKLVKYKDFK